MSKAPKLTLLEVVSDTPGSACKWRVAVDYEDDDEDAPRYLTVTDPSGKTTLDFSIKTDALRAACEFFPNQWVMACEGIGPNADGHPEHDVLERIQWVIRVNTLEPGANYLGATPGCFALVPGPQYRAIGFSSQLGARNSVACGDPKHLHDCTIEMQYLMMTVLDEEKVVLAGSSICS